MHGQADRASRVLQAALDRLADPEGGVGGEAKALAPVELLAGPDQPEHALLDEVGERQALVLVAPRVGGDQAQVGVDEQFLGVQVAALDPLGEVDLLGGREQRVAARVREQLVDRLGDERLGRLRASRSAGLSSRSATRAGSASTGSGGLRARRVAAREIELGVMGERANLTWRPSNPMLGVGIILLDSCVVNYSCGRVSGDLVRHGVRAHLPAGPHKRPPTGTGPNPRAGRKARIQGCTRWSGSPIAAARCSQRDDLSSGLAGAISSSAPPA